MNRRFDLGFFEIRERRVQINLDGDSFMQILTHQTQAQWALTLSLAIGVTGSAQALTRLKAKLELAVEDVLQDLSLQANNELGVVIGRSTIETSISQPGRDTYDSNGAPRDPATEKPEVPQGTTSLMLPKGVWHQ